MILVTGATGFVGLAIVEYLADNGNKYKAIVRNKKPKLPNDINLKYISDIGPETDWSEALDGIEVVIHTAARAHILNDNVTNPLLEFRRVNTAGTLNLARQAAKLSVKRFIFISSIGVNGAETTSCHFNENIQEAPHADYAISKFEAEQGLKIIADETGMEVVIIRPPLVYDGDAPGNMGRLLNLVSKGLPLPLASVNNQRSFISRKNLVDFIILCLDHPKAANQTFLVADSEYVSTPQLIRLLAEGMNKPARLLPCPVSLLKFGAKIFGRESTYQQLCGSLQIDISKAYNLLNWQPPISVEDGLKQAAKRFLEQQGN